MHDWRSCKSFRTSRRIARAVSRGTTSSPRTTDVTNGAIASARRASTQAGAAKPKQWTRSSVRFSKTAVKDATAAPSEWPVRMMA